MIYRPLETEEMKAIDRKWSSGHFSRFHYRPFPVVIHKGDDQFQIDITSASGRIVAFVKFQWPGLLQQPTGTKCIVPLDEDLHLRPYVIAVIGDDDQESD